MQMEIISDLRERKLQVRTEERQGGYGTELLNNTAVEGIVGPAELSVDGEVQYTFSFGEKETLTEYLKKEKLDEKKLLRLYRQFLEKMLLVEEYFLVPENLILCSDAIFLTSERELYLAYMDGYAADVADELAKITEEIMKVMDHGCRSLTFLVYGIHKICREEHFTLNKLEQYLAQYHYEEEPREFVPHPPADDKAKRTEKPKKETGKKREWLIGGVVILGIAWYMGWLNEIFTIRVWQDWCKVGLLFCVIIAIWGISKKTGKKEHVLQYEKNTAGMGLCLKPIEEHDKLMQIDHSPYYIGNDEMHVEGVILQKDVSEVHAKIIIEEKAVFLIDQESEKGTFVNEQRLVPWECRRLKDGDIVDISSHRYQAVMTGDMSYVKDKKTGKMHYRRAKCFLSERLSGAAVK